MPIPTAQIFDLLHVKTLCIKAFVLMLPKDRVCEPRIFMKYHVFLLTLRHLMALPKEQIELMLYFLCFFGILRICIYLLFSMLLWNCTLWHYGGKSAVLQEK